MLSLVALVRTDISKERTSETSVGTRATRRDFPEDGILQDRRRENFKSDMVHQELFIMLEVLTILLIFIQSI
jgi:hypothetical protein